MDFQISKNKSVTKNQTRVFLLSGKKQLAQLELDAKELKYAKHKAQNSDFIVINKYDYLLYIHILSNDKKFSNALFIEKARTEAVKLKYMLNKNKLDNVAVVDMIEDKDICLGYVEGLILSNYQFLKYFKEKDKKQNTFKSVNVICEQISKKDVEQLSSVLEGVYNARDLVNEPLSYLTAEQLSKEIKLLAKQTGFSVEVLQKKQIEALKMGGLLAVNKGSVDPPTFNILEWKPAKYKNKKPVVLVGKGIVFDTGGLSLKPTSGSMDSMKSDMSGAAAVVGAFYAIAKARLPIHVIGLVPATDNRPGGNAYAPQDIIHMHNGMTVEVLNTDAEGRMILADALSYAQKYNPEITIDLATLTGSAHAAIGTYGIVGMGTADEKQKNSLKQSGDNVCERVVEFPFWDEYGELIKSDFADIKNVGGRVGGAITAGKFLEHFTNYPWMHLDIAGPAYLDSLESYKGKGGTGVGVRLLFDFLKNKC